MLSNPFTLVYDRWLVFQHHLMSQNSQVEIENIFIIILLWAGPQQAELKIR